jgi:hypothetical protein
MTSIIWLQGHQHRAAPDDNTPGISGPCGVATPEHENPGTMSGGATRGTSKDSTHRRLIARCGGSGDIRVTRSIR